MSKGGMTNCCLYLMYVFTFLFWLCGCAVLGVALYLRFNSDVRTIFSAMDGYYSDPESFTDIDQIGTQFYFYFCYALMCLGGIIMFIGFIGCCGTIYESPCILCFFSFLLLILMIAEIGGSGYGWYEIVYRNPNDASFSHGEGSNEGYKQTGEAETGLNRIQTWVAKDMQNLINDPVANKETLDAIQQTLKCCGSEGPSSYGTSAQLSVNHPINTCSDLSFDSTPVDNNDLYQTGCNEKLSKFLREHVMAGVVVVGCVGVFQAFGILFAICLCCGIRSNDDYSNA